MVAMTKQCPTQKAVYRTRLLRVDQNTKTVQCITFRVPLRLLAPKGHKISNIL